MNKGFFSLLGFINKDALDTEGLAEIIKATPNPDVAIDMLLGQYSPPEYSEVVNDNKGRKCYALRYEPWTDQIVFETKLPVTYEHFYLTEEDKARVIEEGIDTIEAFKASGIQTTGGDNCSYVKLYSKETKVSTLVVSRKVWEAREFDAANQDSRIRYEYRQK